MLNSYDKIAEQWHSNFRGQAYVDRVLAYCRSPAGRMPEGRRYLIWAAAPVTQLPNTSCKKATVWLALISLDKCWRLRSG